MGQPIKGQLSIENLSRWLDAPLSDALGFQYGRLQFSLLSAGNKVADGTTVLLLRNSVDKSLAVVMCSPPVSPYMVKRAMDREHQAKLSLGKSTGSTILDPLAQGSVQGLSYAVLPYCHSLSESRSVWWIQRALLRPSIFDWLRRATQCTLRDVEPDAIERSFAAPLKYMESLKPVNEHLRQAASVAIGRLKDRAWVPKHVLMHGDLWKGNILIRPEDKILRWLNISDRFVITDWAGSEILGYAIYDLIRLAESMHLNITKLRQEVDQHCRLLECEPVDAKSHLLTALGHIAMNLEHFPIDRYAHLADSCYATLERTLESR